MKLDEWKDVPLIEFNDKLFTIREYAWVNALTDNIIAGIIALILLEVMFLILEGITLLAVSITASVMISILAVGTFFLKEAYAEEIIGKIEITEYEC